MGEVLLETDAALRGRVQFAVKSSMKPVEQFTFDCICISTGETLDKFAKQFGLYREGKSAEQSKHKQRFFVWYKNDNVAHMGQPKCAIVEDEFWLPKRGLLLKQEIAADGVTLDDCIRAFPCPVISEEAANAKG